MTEAEQSEEPTEFSPKFTSNISLEEKTSAKKLLKEQSNAQIKYFSVGAMLKKTIEITTPLLGSSAGVS